MLLGAFLAFCVSASDDSASGLSTPSQGQVTSKREAPKSSYERYGKWQAGVSGGMATGGGLAVRYWWNERNGLEVHGFANLSRDEYPEADGSSGCTYCYSGSDTGTVATGEMTLGVHYLHEVFRTGFFEEGWLSRSFQLRGLTFVGIGAHSWFEDRSLRSQRYQSVLDTSGYYRYEQRPYQDERHDEARDFLSALGGGLEAEFGRVSLHMMFGYGGVFALDGSSYDLHPSVDGGLFVRF